MRRRKMERPRGLDPPPTAWQAVVLPLYYGRFASAFQFIARAPGNDKQANRSEEHTSELQSRLHLVCRLLPLKIFSNIFVYYFFNKAIKNRQPPIPTTSE